MGKPWLIGHRGASGSAPENTMAAFRLAIEQGAGFLETDLHLTRDAHLVAIHDATLERTTSGRGFVKELNLAELLELDAGSWFAPDFAGERIPTLEQVLAFARETDIGLFLEIKQESAWGIEHSLVGSLRSAGESHRVVVLSFSEGILRNLRRLDNTLMSGLLFDSMPGGVADLIERALSIGVRQLAPRLDLLSPELVAAARQHDLQVVVWTANLPEEMRASIAAGVDGIMTDFPARLRDLLQNG
jgi:glycerophosphoryl diester phosphodiesterase